METVGPASTQWQDYTGTVALDGEGPASTFLLDEANLDAAEWAVVGFNFFGAEPTQMATLYAVKRSVLTGHDGLPGLAADLGAVPVTAFDLPADRAVRALTHAFKQWNLVASYKGVAMSIEDERAAR